MNKVVINDFAPNAEKDVVCLSFNFQGDEEFKLLDINARELINYASFTGLGIDLADPTLEFATENDNIGHVSGSCSDSQRNMTAPDGMSDILYLKLDANKQYSAPGITFHFWQNFCTEINIRWYHDKTAGKAELLDEKTVYPDSLTYYYENPVEGFNRINIEFLKTEIPYQFVKLAGIDLGRTREITDFVSNIDIFTEIDPDCADLPGSTCDFVAKSTEFTPQNMQALYVYGGKEEKLFGKFIIDRVPTIGKNIYSFECSDEIMKLQNSDFSQKSQGSYTVSELTEEIKEQSNIDIDCGEYADTTLTGFIEKDKTTRLAAAMISFATRTFLTGFGSRVLRFTKPRERRQKIISSSQILGKPEYMQTPQYTNITLNKYEGSFDVISDTRTANNVYQRASSANNPLTYDRYSLFTDIDSMFNQIAETGFNRDEITARILYNNESIGDICAIETPYDGIKTGIIKSMNISIGNRITATIKMIARDFSSEGSEE